MFGVFVILALGSAIAAAGGHCTSAAPAAVGEKDAPVRGADKTVEALVEALKSQDGQERRRAAQGLGRLGAKAKAAIPALAAAMKDEENRVRFAASQALAQVGPEGAPVLIEYLNSGDDYQRRIAALALRKLGPAAGQAVPPLTRALKHKDHQVRSCAASALGAIGPGARSAVPVLTAILKDEGDDTLMLTRSVRALGKIGPPAKPAVGALIDQALRHSDPHVQRPAAEALGMIGSVTEDVVPALKKALEDEKPGVAEAAAKALKRIDRTDATFKTLEPTRGLSTEQRKIIDEVVASAMAKIQADIARRTDLAGSIARLAAPQKGPRDWVPAYHVGRCVQQCRRARVPVPKAINEKVINDIILRYKNPIYSDEADRRRHRGECARALGWIDHPKAVAVIRDCLKADGGELAWRAVEGSTDKRLLADVIRLVNPKDPLQARPAARFLARHGKEGVPTLRKILGANTLAARRTAINSLAHVCWPECLPPLEQLLRSGQRLERDTKRELIVAIGTLRCRAVDKTYLPAVWPYEDQCRLFHLGALTTGASNPQTARKMESVLWKLGATLAASVLRRQISSTRHVDTGMGPAYEISRRAGELMARIGEPAIPALLDALHDKYEHSRSCAARALKRITGQDLGTNYAAWRRWCLRSGKLTPPGSLPRHPSLQAERITALIKALGLEEGGLEAVRNTCDALARIGPAAVPALTMSLADKDMRVRGFAAIALGKIGPAAHKAVPALAGLLMDEDWAGQRAAGALAKMGPEGREAVPALLRLLKHKNGSLRSRAVRTLGAIGAGAKDAVPALTQAMTDKDELVRRSAAEALKQIAASDARTDRTGGRGWPLKAKVPEPALPGEVPSAKTPPAIAADPGAAIQKVLPRGWVVEQTSGWGRSGVMIALRDKTRAGGIHALVCIVPGESREKPGTAGKGKGKTFTPILEAENGRAHLWADGGGWKTIRTDLAKALVGMPMRVWPVRTEFVDTKGHWHQAVVKVNWLTLRRLGMTMADFEQEVILALNHRPVAKATLARVNTGGDRDRPLGEVAEVTTAPTGRRARPEDLPKPFHDYPIRHEYLVGQKLLLVSRVHTAEAATATPGVPVGRREKTTTSYLVLSVYKGPKPDEKWFTLTVGRIVHRVWKDGRETTIDTNRLHEVPAGNMLRQLKRLSFTVYMDAAGRITSVTGTEKIAAPQVAAGLWPSPDRAQQEWTEALQQTVLAPMAYLPQSRTANLGAIWRVDGSLRLVPMGYPLAHSLGAAMKGSTLCRLLQVKATSVGRIARVGLRGKAGDFEKTGTLWVNIDQRRVVSRRVELIKKKNIPPGAKGRVSRILVEAAIVPAGAQLPRTWSNTVNGLQCKLHVPPPDPADSVPFRERDRLTFTLRNISNSPITIPSYGGAVPILDIRVRDYPKLKSPVFFSKVLVLPHVLQPRQTWTYKLPGPYHIAYWRSGEGGEPLLFDPAGKRYHLHAVMQSTRDELSVPGPDGRRKVKCWTGRLTSNPVLVQLPPRPRPARHWPPTGLSAPLLGPWSKPGPHGLQSRLAAHMKAFVPGKYFPMRIELRHDRGKAWAQNAATGGYRGIVAVLDSTGKTIGSKTIRLDFHTALQTREIRVLALIDLSDEEYGLVKSGKYVVQFGGFRAGGLAKRGLVDLPASPPFGFEVRSADAPPSAKIPRGARPLGDNFARRIDVWNSKTGTMRSVPVKKPNLGVVQLGVAVSDGGTYVVARLATRRASRPKGGCWLLLGSFMTTGAAERGAPVREQGQYQ